MATYKVIELMSKLYELLNDGYEYVNIYEIEEENEYPTALSFEAIDEACNIDYESIDSVKIPDDYDFYAPLATLKLDDHCFSSPLTYRDMFTVKHAVNNALEYFKECLNDPSYSKDTLSDIKQSSIECRNLQAKLAHYLKDFSVK